jgi:CheY-like chemotaxis protein
VFLPAATKKVEPVGLEPISNGLRGRETILVVEDEESLRTILSLNLRQLGYEVLEATDGRAAMAVWEAKGSQIDLLLTDMVMPQGGNGLDLAERFKRNKPRLKVIVSSGYSIEMGGHAINGAAGIVYLPKPYTMGVLANPSSSVQSQKAVLKSYK